MIKLSKALYVLKIAALVLFISTAYYLSVKENSLNQSIKFQFSFQTKVDNFVTNDALKIASVVCSSAGNNGPREEAATMMKSVIVSTIMYNIPNDIEFHLFIEHEADKEYFWSKLTDFGYPFSHAEISLHFHSAINAVPKKYRKKLSYDKRFRCMYTRIFFPSALPDIDGLLYVDTDILTTGNVMDLWGHFYKMNSEQFVGITTAHDAKSPRKPFYVQGIPYPGTKGLNSGLLLMNLTRMRDYLWEQKMLRLYRDYGTKMLVNMNDQKLLNILIYFDSGIMLQLPCQYNYWLTYCRDGIYCEEAGQDPNGIQVIHGGASGFDRGQAFREIFTVYRDFPLGGAGGGGNASTPAAIVSQLMALIRDNYSNVTVNNNGRRKKFPGHGKCDAAIGTLLFKSFF